MAETDYQQQYGMKLYYGDVDALVGDIDEPLAGIKEFGELPGGEVADIDITRVDQADPHKKMVDENMIDPGQIGATLGLKVSQVSAVQALVGVAKAFKILFADGGTVHFNGYIKSYKPKAQKGDEATCEVAIRVNGKPTWTAA